MCPGLRIILVDDKVHGDIVWPVAVVYRRNPNVADLACEVRQRIGKIP
jgi:hypothetical protein